jgi:hypothetical protein
MTRFHGQVEVLDQRDVGEVAEGDILEPDPAAHRVRASGGGLVGFLLVGVEQREHALGRGDAGLEQVRHRRDLGQRLAELA